MTEEIAVARFRSHLAEEGIVDDGFEWPETDRDDELVIRRLDRDRPSYWQRQYERASLVYGMRWVMQKVQPADEPEACRDSS